MVPLSSLGENEDGQGCKVLLAQLELLKDDLSDLCHRAAIAQVDVPVQGLENILDGFHINLSLGAKIF